MLLKTKHTLHEIILNLQRKTRKILKTSNNNLKQPLNKNELQKITQNK